MSRSLVFHNHGCWRSQFLTGLVFWLFWCLSWLPAAQSGVPTRSSAIQTFALSSLNTPPTVDPIPPQTISENATLRLTNVGISDSQTPAANLSPKGTSSNTHLVRDEDIVITRTNLIWSLSATPAPNRFGTTLITVLVTDPQFLTGSNSFLLTVSPESITNFPAIRLVKPEIDETFLAPGRIVLEADAVDVTGSITKVDFFNGQSQTPIGSATNSPYQFVWNGVGPSFSGYDVRARAIAIRDNLLLTNYSSPVHITVRNVLIPAPTRLTLLEGQSSLVPVPGGNPVHPTFVDIITFNESAMGQADYEPISTQLLWATGETIKSFRIQSIDDNYYEGDETFRVEFMNPSDGLPLYQPLIVTILDNDPKPVVSIDDVEKLEGSGGTNSVSLTLSLSAPLDLGLSVDFLINDETAVLGKDFLWARAAVHDGSVFFDRHQTNIFITFEITTDSIDETHETFFVDLFHVDSFAELNPSKTRGSVTILDDDSPPTVSITDASAVTEGFLGTKTNATFLVSLSEASGKRVTVHYSTGNRTATGGLDFEGATNSTVPIEAGQLSANIVIPVLGDPFHEDPETFVVDLVGVDDGNAIIDQAHRQGQGTIIDDDVLPEISIRSSFTVSEGNTSTNILVSLSITNSLPVTVDFVTANGTAIAELDYVSFPNSSVTNSLTFNPGDDLTKSIPVLVKGDTLDETDETFLLRLINPSNAIIATNQNQALITISDDDLPPLISIQNASVDEGNSGVTNMAFTVSLSAASGKIVQVDFATTNGTARAGLDYVATTNRLIFNPGDTSKTFLVIVNGDILNEADETILIDLFNPNPTNALLTPANSRGRGTIRDDDLQPSITIEKAAPVTEGNTGTTGAVFFLTLSAPSGQIVTFDYATANGTAQANSDYVPESGTVTFKPGEPGELGETLRAIVIQVKGDTAIEPNETFLIRLSNPTNTVLVVSQVEGTIIDDEDRPALSVDSVSVSEGNSGSARFTVRLSAPSAEAISVNFATTNGTALAGLDYTAISTNLVFNPDQTTNIVNIQVLADNLRETDETFSVLLSNPLNAFISGPEGIGTILDDDPIPTIIVESSSISEGNGDSVNLVIPLTLSAPTKERVSVDVVTSDGTATAGSDYLASTNTVFFLPDETAKTIVVVVKGDFLDEMDETLFLRFSNATGAFIPAQPVQLTIEDDDLVPVISISDVSVGEGDMGPTNAVFIVSLSAPTSQPVTVGFRTASGTAAENDFVGITNTVAFNPGETKQLITTIAVTGDSRKESDETFSVILANPVNATLGDDRGQGTIVDDDPFPSLSIDDVSISEGHNGPFEAKFAVNLSLATDQIVTVDFATANDTATAGSDYLSAFGTITFNRGQTNQSVIVVVNGDTLHELNESFVVNLSNERNVTLTDAQGRCEIRNDDAAPVISIADTPIPEGSSGFSRVSFVVSLSNVSSLPVTVDFATGGGNAIADVDYISNSGELTFNPGETEKTIPIVVLGDTVSEPNKTFLVSLSNPKNVTLGKDRGLGTILDDDAAPALTITDASVTEGNSGTTFAIFKVSLSETNSLAVTVNVRIADQTTIAGLDYESIPPFTLTFEPGQTNKVITVAVKGDTEAELEETFLVVLSGEVNAKLLDGEAVGTITDDDVPVEIFISDAPLTESDAGFIDAVFLVSLSAPSDKPITVNYATTDDSATVDSDYLRASGTLMFVPGSTGPLRITVSVKGDLLNEAEERFFVNLSNPNNAVLLDPQGIGVIANNDPLPEISIGDTNVTEGGIASFVVRLSPPSGLAVTVQFATANGSATAPDDFAATSGPLTFVAGETTRTISITTADNSLNEPEETFSVRLAGAVNATISDDQAIGKIADNDALPTFSINNVTVTEGDAGTVSAVFVVSLTPSSTRTNSVSFTTVSGTATSPDDFGLRSGTLVFPPGVTSTNIVVPVNGDRIDEPNETFFIDLSAPINAVLGVAKRGMATILDDDIEPTLSITDAAAPEGSVGTNQLVFTVRLSALSSQTVTAHFTTTDGSAVAGNDYALTAGSLTFSPGTLTNVIRVPTIPDAFYETNETFEVRLSEVQNARLADGAGLGTILNDDVAPTLTISDAVVTEGNSGRTNALFTVRLSIASSQVVAVDFKTSDGTASVGLDFSAGSGTLTFPAGTVTQTVSVPVLGDTLFETSETFSVTLTNAINASIADAVGLGTILNDDTSGNQPPTVQITSPANGSAIMSPVELPIAVEARDSDGKVQRVDFFIGSMLLGSRAGPPFTLTWTNEAAGAYSLTAVAVDDNGASTTSAPVNILISRGIAATDVAIVRNFPDPEITLLQNYLLELGVSSQIFDQEGLSFDALKECKLIIWDDLGSAAGGLSDKDVEIFRQAFINEISLFFIGEALVGSAKNLSVLPRSQWIDLIHLAPSGDAAGNGTVTLDQATNHPVINGHFGIIRSFGYSTNFNGVLQPAPGVFALGRSGTSDVLLVFEDEFSVLRTRTVAQSFQVTKASDARSLAERKRLFKNSASWLLRKSFQSLTDLSIELTGPSEPAMLGQPLTYTATIRHQGEIAGTGVTLTIPLPPNMKFGGGTFIQGTVTEAEGAIIYNLGNMESAQQTLFSFVIIPTAPAKTILQATVSGNEADPGLFNNSASIETLVFGDLPDTPKLTLVRLENQNFQLLLSGPPKTAYRLQVSTDLVNWLTLTNVTASQSPLTLDGPGATKLSERFYRIVPP
jgi:uncharacterized repeat protein (TIGR01451 family)